MKFDWGPSLFRQLQGVFCVYKPSGLPVHKIIDTLQGNLTRDINALPCYKHERRVCQGFLKENNGGSNLPTVTSVPVTSENVAQHRLALGPRYIKEDFQLTELHGMSRHASGVLVIGLNQGCDHLEHISLARYLKVYHVRGRFGWATHNFSPKGRIIERTSFYHITGPRLDKVCASVQANHTKHMFEYAGVDPNSQEAYELAVTGLVRPNSARTPPMLYGVKCIEFNLPDFTLEIHAINEKTTYLMHLIHDIGLSLKSTAVCTHVRRIRYGYFTLEHALLQKHWQAEHIVENIRLCRKLLTVDKLITSRTVEHSGDDRKRMLPGSASYLGVSSDEDRKLFPS